MQEVMQICPEDKVAVALCPLKKGKKIIVGKKEIELVDDISQGHKFALCNINQGESIVKYGQPIGKSKIVIAKGEWVHIHNVATGLNEEVSYKYEPAVNSLMKSKSTTFRGYKRPDGKVGIRNELWILPTVGCVNSVAKLIAELAKGRFGDGVDNIVAYTHPYGCSQMGEDQENTRNVLVDMMQHPNAGGVLVIGLGCENSNIPVLMDYLGDYDSNRIRFLQCQDYEDEIDTAMVILEELYSHVSSYKREECDVSELIVGLKCGGSDGLSGITANPIVGEFSDILISQGGTTILTEVPEMFGAEALLMNRCKNEEVFIKMVKMINDFKNYFIKHDQTIYENPSPGNKKGGITTLEDKSLGCTQKAGTAPVNDVVDYGQRVKEKGLNLLNAPGNDLVAATALAVSGAHMVLFTTGRGTPFATLVPTMKISSNTQLSEYKSNWIDFNAGQLLEGSTMHKMGKALFEYVVSVASGECVKSEAAGFQEIAIFKQGVTL